MRRIRGRDLSFGTGAERNAPESLTPGIVLLRSPQHIAQIGFGGTRSSLRPASRRRLDDEILKPRDALESNQKWERVNRDSFFLALSHATGVYPGCAQRIRASRAGPTCGAGEGGEIERREIEPGEGFVSTDRHPSSALASRGHLLPQGGEGRERQFVLATRGGVGVVMNEVASSMATPRGVGITMRYGTRMRVPRTGANAISMLRAAVRYLITGRSGM